MLHSSSVYLCSEKLFLYLTYLAHFASFDLWGFEEESYFAAGKILAHSHKNEPFWNVRWLQKTSIVNRFVSKNIKHLARWFQITKYFERSWSQITEKKTECDHEVFISSNSTVCDHEMENQRKFTIAGFTKTVVSSSSSTFFTVCREILLFNLKVYWQYSNCYNLQDGF